MRGSERLHIAIACPACGPPLGSVASVAVRHSIELSRYFRVTLISDNLPPGTLAEEDRARVTPRRFDYLRRFCHVPNEYSFARSVRTRLSEVHEITPIDMVICHGHALATLAAAPLKRKRGVPFALVAHGDIFERPVGTYDARLTRFYKWVTPQAYKNADLVIALSPDMARRAISGGAKPEAVSVIPNGIDPVDIGFGNGTPKDRARRAPEGTFRLVFVGALSATKGVDVLVRACEILLGRGLDFSLDIIGEGPLEQHLRRLVEETGLAGRIRFLGRIPRRELGQHYASADIACVPSISDPLPTVVLEALACGTPVIGSDVGGIPFMIEDGVNGVIVPPSNSEALARAVEAFAGRRAAIGDMGLSAISSVAARFDWEAVGRQIRDLVERAVMSVQSSALQPVV